jgi:hypothetical protein
VCAALFNYSDLGDLRGFPGEEHRKGSTRSRTKMPSDQVIAVDLIDLLGQELSVRIVGSNVYMRRRAERYTRMMVPSSQSHMNRLQAPSQSLRC